MTKIQAWEQLNNPEYSSKLGMVDFHNLLLKAGIDAKTAKKAANERGWQRLSNEEML